MAAVCKLIQTINKQQKVLQQNAMREMGNYIVTQFRSTQPYVEDGAMSVASSSSICTATEVDHQHSELANTSQVMHVGEQEEGFMPLAKWRHVEFAWVRLSEYTQADLGVSDMKGDESDHVFLAFARVVRRLLVTSSRCHATKWLGEPPGLLWDDPTIML